MSKDHLLDDNCCRVIPVREILQSCSETVLKTLVDSVEICGCCGEIRPKHIETSIRTTGKCNLCNSLYEDMRRDSLEALENMLAISRYLKIEINTY